MNCVLVHIARATRSVANAADDVVRPAQVVASAAHDVSNAPVGVMHGAREENRAMPESNSRP